MGAAGVGGFGVCWVGVLFGGLERFGVVVMLDIDEFGNR